MGCHESFREGVLLAGITSGAGLFLHWIQIVRKVTLGCMIGLVGALISARLVRDLLYGVSPTDPLVLGAVCALLISVALLATWIPARRGASIDPMQTLRAE